jgi:hypothetical protein
LRKAPDFVKEIAPQFEYNTYIRDFLKDNIDVRQSAVTTEDAEKHMNEDFSIHYYGEPEALMSEARRLTKVVNGKIKDEEFDFFMAGGELDSEYILSIIVRTDVDQPFMDYSIIGMKDFE